MKLLQLNSGSCFIPIVIGFFLSVKISHAQIDDTSIHELESIIDSIINVNMQSQHIPGAAYVLVNKERTLLKKGFGLATTDNLNDRFDPDSTIFRIGSISKTFTVAALLQLLANYEISLHDNVNDYLKRIKVPDTFAEPVTFHQIMTHSSGFDEVGGRRVFNQEELIPLHEFLENNLRRIREPGVISSYSSYAIALAGLLVEDISGLPLEEYMRKNIWTPMSMNMTNMFSPEEQASYVSPGYEYFNGVNHPQQWEWYHTYPSSDINSTVADMGEYLKMLLSDGMLNGNQILSTRLANAMLQQQLSTHEKVDGFAYGFYQRTRYNVQSVCHGGNMLGYSAMLTVIPDKEIGFFIINHHEGSNIRNTVNDAILEYFGSLTELSNESQNEEIDLSRFEGEYRWMTYCHTCPNVRLPESRGITISGDNMLHGFGRDFYQVEPYVFRSTDGQRIMGFTTNDQGEIEYMSLGGINTFEKVN